MIVARSEVAMASMHTRVSSMQTRLDVRSWGSTVGRGSSGPERPVATLPANSNSPAANPVGKASGTAAGSEATEDGGLSPQDAQKVRMIEALIEALTGKKVKLKIWNGKCPDQDRSPVRSGPDSKDAAAQAPAGEGGSGWGLEISYTRRQWEEESLSYSANGTVKTADGRTLEFALSMGMRRQESSETSLVLRAGDAPRKKDPLVLNFQGNAPNLAERRTEFDLDDDGKTDSVHFATGGSAFLARDIGTGLVDGSNLFGPSTGDGYGELSAFDADGNGWIDSGDPVWADLRLWNKDESGQDWVWYLEDKGVGAISLARASTPFTLEGADGRETGSIGETGVWIGESGTDGTVNHVDLVA